MVQKQLMTFWGEIPFQDDQEGQTLQCGPENKYRGTNLIPKSRKKKRRAGGGGKKWTNTVGKVEVAILGGRGEACLVNSGKKEGRNFTKGWFWKSILVAWQSTEFLCEEFKGGAFTQLAPSGRERRLVAGEKEICAVERARNGVNNTIHTVLSL